ncbi:DUF1707 domain-containing protein [Streptacidiphilus sp. N1-12]|uniref:DUF1707 domain-containing protein n=2 Tax=Streptacidiphilus alkalitolerans TaxID=3342712 RepID=A0ABV6XAJ6_9ACTN
MSRRDLVPDPLDPGDPHALRASHEDRDEVVEQLRVAAGDGRLTAEELDERLETALTARTYGELALLVRDLPTSAGPSGPPRAVPAEPAPEVVRLAASHSNLERVGRWAVPLRLELEAKGANVLLDFTAAAVTHPVLDLAVSLRHSNLRLVVPAGVVVEVDELAVHGSNVRQRVGQQPGAPDLLRIRLSGDARSSSVQVRDQQHRQLGFWARLRERRAARRQALAA